MDEERIYFLPHTQQTRLLNSLSYWNRGGLLIHINIL